LKANKVNLFVSSVLFVFWYHSPNVFETPRITRTMLHTASMWYQDIQTEITESEGLLLGMFNNAV
jgi:hypothetical protein